MFILGLPLWVLSLFLPSFLLLLLSSFMLLTFFILYILVAIVPFINCLNNVFSSVRFLLLPPKTTKRPSTPALAHFICWFTASYPTPSCLTLSCFAVLEISLLCSYSIAQFRVGNGVEG
ncbi:hypothetical protein GLYMA_07G210950v4 [Glycine max]|nr:hypothetical protein GLYMA_07G210950v4 [Glycine max]KAH1087874.1 hypothetical protein GYH30_019108 [Glycine max]